MVICRIPVVMRRSTAAMYISSVAIRIMMRGGTRLFCWSSSEKQQSCSDVREPVEMWKDILCRCNVVMRKIVMSKDLWHCVKVQRCCAKRKHDCAES